MRNSTRIEVAIARLEERQEDTRAVASEAATVARDLAIRVHSLEVTRGASTGRDRGFGIAWTVASALIGAGIVGIATR